MSTHRWIKFWPQDYEGDTALRVCSLAAQGLWMRLLCAMHRSEPYGHLTVNGKGATTRQIAALSGTSEREAARLIAELEDAGVLSRDDGGTIYSRRLVRDKATSDTAREHGKQGGNPNLKPPYKGVDKGEGKPGGLTPPVKHQEAEAEAETEDTSLRSVSPARAARSLPSDPRGFAEFWDAYPAKVGKAAARKAFPKAVKAAGGDPAQIVFGLKARLHLFPNDPQFIPNPATWLNQGRWDDDPDTLFARSQRSN